MKNNFLSSFTPSLMSPKMLEDIFVQRHKLVEYLIELVEDSCNSHNKHFRLLVGMRGVGKTHTIALLYHRLKERANLQDKLLIAWLKEEEWGVSSWLDLLLRIFKALEKEYTVDYHLKIAKQVESLYQLSAEEATPQAEAILKEFILEDHNKTLLLLTENLDEIFNGLGDIGQKQFRAFLQNYNLITIVATSQSLFNGVSKKDAAFYGFFTPEYLKKLTIEEATNLLRKIAETQKDQELETFIQSTTGKERIKAIHHLAGGNHRVYIIFSQFLTRDSLDDLVQPVMQTLDELTPYYQARMQWLSPQQRKIIELLCDTGNSITVKEIARKCFITHQTASSQLKDLRTKGYVVTVGDIATGRESYYELQEPLMRICLEVKKQRGEPIKLFIDFLRIWYTEDELKQRLEILPTDCLEREYINHALEAKTESIKFDITEKFQEISQAIEEDNFEKALELSNLAINNNPANHEAWYNRGVALFKLGKLEEAVTSWDRAIEIKPDDDQAWYNRGLALVNLGKLEEAVASWEQAIEIKPDDDQAWYNRGLALVNLGKLEEAVTSWDQAIEIKPDDDQAWYNRGVALDDLGKLEEAVASLDKAIEIEPDLHQAWYNRGIALRNLGKLEEAVTSYAQAIEIKPDYYQAWYNRGIALRNLGKLEEAVASYDRAIEIKPNLHQAWNNRGYALDDLGKLDEAVASYDRAIEINPDDNYAHFNRIEPILKLNRWKEGFKDLEEALNQFKDTEDSYKGDTTAYIKIIWESTTDIAVWKNRLTSLVETYAKYELAGNLIKGIINHIPILMSDMVSDKAARSWLEIWQEIAGDKPELTIALRFLKTAVEYKETKGDRKVLLQLAKEERELIKELLE